MKVFEDRFWASRDGLKLHFRDYPAPEGAADSLPVLCLHGLTRNARDFDVLAPHLAQGRRVICPDLRGRGDSEYARDSATYTPMQYCEDVLALLDQEGVDRFVAIGTSLGGLMMMGLATVIPGRFAGAVINDVGPWLEPAGLARIKDYVGQGRTRAGGCAGRCASCTAARFLDRQGQAADDGGEQRTHRLRLRHEDRRAAPGHRRR
jgi:pimeloyl-ACP methyl ester carboxylesterase